MSHCSGIVNDTFVWKIENFTGLKKETSQVFTSKVLDDSLWFLDLYIHEPKQEKRKCIDVFLNWDGENHKDSDVIVDFTITILAQDVSSNISKKSISTMFDESNRYNGFRRIASVEELFAKRNVYLPKDILSVQCYIERKIIDLTIAGKSESSEIILQSDCNINGLSKDLLRLYLDSKFCDVRIATGDRLFSVHKNVICARSPVFSAMFENDWKENKSNTIDITDVDSATMNRLLMFIYSDVAEDMGQKDAEKLYAAADVYEVLHLKQRCSSALKTFICNASLADIYTLADMHQDSDLKIAVEGYVFLYMNSVFRSTEWRKFMQLNPPLSAELMHKVLMQLLGK